MSGPSNPCATCGKPCPPHAGRGRPRKWCSPECRPSSQRAWHMTAGYVPPGCADYCTACGKRVQRRPTSAAEIVCRTCRRANPKPRPMPKPYEPRTCPLCSCAFAPHRHDQRYCSMDCRRTLQRTNWKTSTGNPKYKTREHRRERAKWARLMASQGYLECQQPVCVMPTRIINDGDRWHLGHDDTGAAYIGPTHMTCNVKDGARRGNRRSRGLPDDETHRRWAV